MAESRRPGMGDNAEESFVGIIQGRKSYRHVLSAAGLVVGALCLSAGAQTTSFTYQGRLTDSGTPVDGVVDLRFRLLDAGGSQLGVTQCADNVAVVGGAFTTTLDFGQQFSGGTGRTLEISVRSNAAPTCADTTAYVTLSPRQPLTPTPTASVSYWPWAMQGGALQITYTGLYVGINAASPLTSATVFQVGNSAAQPTGYAGMFVSTTDGAGKPFYGLAAGSTPRWWTYLDGATGEWRLNRNSVDLVRVNSAGHVGIGIDPHATYLVHIGDKALVDGDLQVAGNLTTSVNRRFYTISGVGFAPSEYYSDPAGVATVTEQGVAGFALDSSLNSFYAPVNLPQGALITRITASCIDQQSVLDIVTSIGRTNINDGNFGTIASVSSSGASNTPQLPSAIVTSFNVVDNQNFTYWAKTVLQGGGNNVHRLVALRIEYEVTTPMP